MGTSKLLGKPNKLRGNDLRWTSIPSRGSRNTPSLFMLQKPGRNGSSGFYDPVGSKASIFFLIDCCQCSSQDTVESRLTVTLLLQPLVQKANAQSVIFFIQLVPLRSFHWNRTNTEIFVKLCLLIRFRRNDDLLLWWDPAPKKKPPFSNAHALILSEIVRSRECAVQYWGMTLIWPPRSYGQICVTHCWLD